MCITLLKVFKTVSHTDAKMKICSKRRRFCLSLCVTKIYDIISAKRILYALCAVERLYIITPLGGYDIITAKAVIIFDFSRFSRPFGATEKHDTLYHFSFADMI